MPITLPPISRRRFLSASLAGAAALTLRPWELFATETKLDPDRLILLSDIHIEANRAFVNKDKVNPWDNLAVATRQIAGSVKEHAAPVLITGDLACATGQAGDYTTLID